MSAIEIVDYDERWPAEFERLRGRLVAALGPLAVRIEHVGSTAVPGLAAKPKVDVDVVVGPDDVERAIQRLRAHLAFRDHLRTHPHTAAEYAALKRDLAARFVTDRDGYTRAKSEFIQSVLAS